MKQRNWDRLQEGDTATCKTSGVEYTLEWLKRKGLDNRRQYKLTPATKARLRALDAPPADPAPVALTADDAAWLREGDELLFVGPGGFSPGEGPTAPRVFAEFKDDHIYCTGEAQYGPLRWYAPTPATAALIAQRKASATLAVGDTVEVTGPTIARRTNEIGKRGVVTEHVPADNTYQVDYADRPGIFCGAFPASSLRRVQPAPDVQPAAPAEQPCEHCLWVGKHAPGCIKAPAEQPALVPESANRGTYDEVSTTDGTKQPAEQPAPAADLRREIEAALEAHPDEDFAAQAQRWVDAILAAAAVPRIAPPAVSRRYAKAYNAGQNSILAPILAALKGGAA